MTLRPTLGHPDHSRGMTDEQLRSLLQASISRMDAAPAPADGWSRVTSRIDTARPAWSMVDTALAAGIVTALLLVPEALFLIALHL
jgi:hypothetical protein